LVFTNLIQGNFVSLKIMEILSDLIRLLKKHRTHYRDDTGLPTNKNSKIYKLVKGLSDGSYEDEERAAQALYGTDASHISFKRLKYRLQNRLLNSLFLIDPEKVFTSPSDRDFFLVGQLQTICGILNRMGEKNLSYKLAKSALHKAKTAHNPYAGLQLSLQLRNRVNNLRDQKKIIKYNAEVKYFQQYIDAELKLSTMHLEYKGLIADPKTEIHQVKEMLNTFLKEIANIKIDYSPRTVYYFYTIFLHDRLINRDIPGTIACCKEGLKKMKPFNRPNLDSLFYFAMVEGHILQKEFEKGSILIFSRIENQDLSHFNTLSSIYYYAILCLTTENYQQFGEALQLFKEHKIEKSQVAFFQENFTIFEMLYYILVTIDKVKPTYPVKSKIRITKFINDLPVFSKDKKGVNTLILFVQFLLLLIKKDYDTIIDRVENLKAYDQKYLRKEDSFRITCFVKMILLIPKNNFHPAAVQRHVVPYLKKLADHKKNNWSWRGTNVETIPYENFWKLFIIVLEKNKNSR